MHHLAVAIAVVATAFAGPARSEDPTPTQAPLEVEQTRDADHDETDDTPERRRNRQATGERQLGNMWWHGPEVGAALELTAEQIESMDQIFLELRAERQEAMSGTREATQRLVEAAAEGDAARIDSLLAGLSDQRSAAAVTDTETARQVLALLTEEQLKTLAERFPVVLERPWVLRLGGDSPRKAIRDAQRRPRPARRQATPAPEDAKPQD